MANTENTKTQLVTDNGAAKVTIVTDTEILVQVARIASTFAELNQVTLTHDQLKLIDAILNLQD